MGLTVDQVAIVKSTAPVIAEHGNSVTSLFYQSVLEQQPSLHNVFNQTNQVNKHQPRALASALLAYATHIDDLGVLSPAVERICQKHASLFIRPEHYPVVGDALIRAMGTVLGDACTPAIVDAWTAAYWQLANIFIARTAQIYTAAEGWTEWRDFVIIDKQMESHDITSFYLKPVDGMALPSFLPGKYVSVRIDHPRFGYKQSRQYSLSEGPRKGHYRISIKREVAGGDGNQTPDAESPSHPGWISNLLLDEKDLDHILELSHPAGDFYLDSTKEAVLAGPIVLLSAGSGITPMISILDTLLADRATQPISFVHSATTTSAHAFSQFVRDTAKSRSNITSQTFISNICDTDTKGVDYDYEGRMTLDMLDEKHVHLKNGKSKYWLCGPEGWMREIYNALKAHGVHEERIMMEVFGTGTLPR